MLNRHLPSLAPEDLRAVQGGTALPVLTALTPITALSTVDWAAVRPQPDPWRISVLVIH